jgi:putative DNA-invertase from lambdoid prophage Rac
MRDRPSGSAFSWPSGLASTWRSGAWLRDGVRQFLDRTTSWLLELLDRLERDDVLVVTKLDRLGRNSIDVQTTVKRLDEMAVRVHCLALGGVDLTSPAGKMTMGVIAAVAQFERDLLIERTLSEQARARAEGKKFGRPAALTDKQREETLQRLADGASWQRARG